MSTLINEEELINDITAKAEAQGVAVADKKQFLRAFIMQVCRSTWARPFFSLTHSLPSSFPLPYRFPSYIFLRKGRTIVTVIDQPYEEEGPMCTVIFRDVTGRYCWQVLSAFLPFNERGIPTKTLEHCALPVPIARYDPSLARIAL